MYHLDRRKQTITIEGKTYQPDDFRTSGTVAFASRSEFHNELFIFLKEWFSDDETITVQTSGSTGNPKRLEVEKKKMINSAELTCSFLGLEEKDTALLCMPLQYIAGKMMVVRALVAGLNLYLIPPCGNPLRETDRCFTFAAMVPLQVYNSLQSDIEIERLIQIKNLIIGGGFIDPQLEKSLKAFPNKIYSSYGMTETLSHIAVRQLNGEKASEYYQPFGSVKISLSEENTLIIDAPLVSNEKLITNDIAKIKKDGSFLVIGRKDNVINSGGVKVQPELIEEVLKPYMNGIFAISSVPDEKLGEAVVLVIEKDIKAEIDIFHPHYKPKKIIKIPSIPLTETGKINRYKLKQLLQK